MKNLNIVFIALFFSFKLIAQHSVAYTYDANGNRDSRYFVGMRLANPNFTNSADSTIAMEKSVALAQEYGLTVYPNPTRDAIQVIMNNSDKDAAELERTELFLIDNSGKTIASKKYNASQNAFDMTNCLPGVYHLKIVFSKKERVDYKVIKVN